MLRWCGATELAREQFVESVRRMLVLYEKGVYDPEAFIAFLTLDADEFLGEWRLGALS